MDGPAQAQGERQPAVPQLLLEPGQKPDTGVNLQSLDRVRSLEGQSLVEAPAKKGFLGFLARGHFGDVAQERGGSPEIVEDPGSGTLGEAIQGLR